MRGLECPLDGIRLGVAITLCHNDGAVPSDPRQCEGIRTASRVKGAGLVFTTRNGKALTSERLARRSGHLQD